MQSVSMSSTMSPSCALMKNLSNHKNKIAFMTREEKNKQIDNLNTQLSDNKNFYLTDISGLTAESNSDLRRLCFKSDVQIQVIKNTLLRKAMEKNDVDFADSLPISKRKHRCIMFAEAGNAPAKLIKEFRKKSRQAGFKSCIY